MSTSLGKSSQTLPQVFHLNVNLNKEKERSFEHPTEDIPPTLPY